MENIIQSKELTKAYPFGKSENVVVLKGVDMAVDEGEFVAVMGASGSGKSTLLYTLSGMERPTGGSVRLLDKQLELLSENELSRLRLLSIGFVFQSGNLLKSLNIEDNIMLPAFRSGKESKEAICSRANKLMKHLQIDKLAQKDINQISGGELQRAAICRALINNPKVIFADEPTGALNSSGAKEVMDILTEINSSKTTIFLVTHDPKVAAKADRILYMRDGNIAQEFHIGKYGINETSMSREKELSSWLAGQGF